MSNRSMRGPEAADLLGSPAPVSEKNARRALRAVSELETELEFLQEREKFFAQALDVCDGGRYRNDWPGALERLIRQRDELFEKVNGTAVKYRVGVCSRDEFEKNGAPGAVHDAIRQTYLREWHASYALMEAGAFGDPSTRQEAERLCRAANVRYMAELKGLKLPETDRAMIPANDGWRPFSVVSA